MPVFPVDVMAVISGLIILATVLLDTFETVVLPRTVSRQFRLTRFFYRITWALWTYIACRVSARQREALLGFYGPLSLLLLLGVWAFGLTFSFAFIQWGLHTPLHIQDGNNSFSAYFYFSGVTFFTLGFGDLAPINELGRIVAVTEAGVGFGFLGVVIGYLPVLYQAFSRREVGISKLDSRASSPPSGVELLRRHADHMDELTAFLADWEQWGAELLESHLSYPILIFYRSQHDRQSWVGALTAIMDACAIISIGFESSPDWEKRLAWQAERTFAISRHAVVDLVLVLTMKPKEPTPNRLPPDSFPKAMAILEEAGLKLKPGAEERLGQIRCGYEPYVNALADRLSLSLPPWYKVGKAEDNWLAGEWVSEHHFFEQNEELEQPVSSEESSGSHSYAQESLSRKQREELEKENTTV